MSTTPDLIDTKMLFGVTVGAAAVVGAFIGVLSLERRRRAARSERPPVNTKLLRPPGYWLSCRLDDLETSLLIALAQTLGAGLLCGIMSVGLFPLGYGLLVGRFTFAQLRAAPNAHLLISVILFVLAAVLWLIRSFLQSLKFVKEMRHYRFGLRGEQAVAEELADPRLARAGYRVFHDFPGGPDWNIDHIVIGPSGVYAIETKTRSKRAATNGTPEHEAVFDGETIRFPWGDDPKAVKQASRNAESLGKFLYAATNQCVVVQGIVALPGWFVILKANCDTKVLAGKQVPGHIVTNKRQLDESQVKTLAYAVEQKCRDIEF